jgi:hypothetical protein
LPDAIKTKAMASAMRRMREMVENPDRQAQRRAYKAAAGKVRKLTTGRIQCRRQHAST